MVRMEAEPESSGFFEKANKTMHRNITTQSVAAHSVRHCDSRSKERVLRCLCKYVIGCVETSTAFRVRVQDYSERRIIQISQITYMCFNSRTGSGLLGSRCQ